ncbi:unnamed protein product [Gadus morhua 'NCC']
MLHYGVIAFQSPSVIKEVHRFPEREAPLRVPLTPRIPWTLHHPGYRRAPIGSLTSGNFGKLKKMALSHNNSGGSSRVDRAQHRRARRDSHEAQISRHRVRASRTSGQPGVRASRWSEGPFLGPSCGRSSWERPESRGEAQQCGITGQLQDTQELRQLERENFGAAGLLVTPRPHSHRGPLCVRKDPWVTLGAQGPIVPP